MTGETTDRREVRQPRPPGWWVFRDNGARHAPSDPLPPLPAPPPWRRFHPDTDSPPLDIPAPDDHWDVERKLGSRRPGTLDHAVVDVINAAIQLRRPLLVTGQPGTGKSSLAHQIAAELGLGRVLWWPVVSRSALRDGLYDYDAIGRVQDAPVGVGPGGERGPLPDVGRYLTLGPLGTALLPWKRPRVLLVDELDKSDIDLPNDLLHIFEEGEFRIRELERLGQSRREASVGTADHGSPVVVRDGRVRCSEFPIVVITSNGERAFSPAFRRRCLEVELAAPDEARLAAMVEAHFGANADPRTRELIRSFLDERGEGSLAADQLLNTVHLVSNGAADADEASWTRLRAALWRSLATDASP